LPTAGVPPGGAVSPRPPPEWRVHRQEERGEEEALEEREPEGDVVG